MNRTTYFQLDRIPTHLSSHRKSKVDLWFTMAREVTDAIGRYEEFDKAYETAPAWRIWQVAEGIVKHPAKETQTAILELFWRLQRLENASHKEKTHVNTDCTNRGINCH